MVLGFVAKNVIPNEIDLYYTTWTVSFWSSSFAGKSAAHSQIPVRSVLWMFLTFLVSLSWDKKAVEVLNLQYLHSKMSVCWINK